MEQLGHQGDTQWYGIDEIPKNAKPIQQRYVAKSEQTGSVHALFGDYDMYELDNALVIDCKSDCILNHTLEKHIANAQELTKPQVLPKKDHRHSVIPKGIYMTASQREYDSIHQSIESAKD